MVYAKFDEASKKVSLHGGKDFDTEYNGFAGIFRAPDKVFDLLEPLDHTKVIQIKNNPKKAEIEASKKLNKKYAIGIAHRLGELLKVVFKNYILDEYSRKNYSNFFNLLDLDRNAAVALLKKIIKDGYQLPPNKIKLDYSFMKKYLDKDFYAKHNKDKTALSESKKTLKVKILKGKVK